MQGEVSVDSAPVYVEKPTTFSDAESRMFGLVRRDLLRVGAAIVLVAVLLSAVEITLRRSDVLEHISERMATAAGLK